MLRTICLFVSALVSVSALAGECRFKSDYEIVYFNFRGKLAHSAKKFLEAESQYYRLANDFQKLIDISQDKTSTLRFRAMRKIHSG